MKSIGFVWFGYFVFLGASTASVISPVSVVHVFFSGDGCDLPPQNGEIRRRPTVS